MEKDSYMHDMNNCCYACAEREPIRVFEAFAGYGGASFAFKRTGITHEIVGYSENDKFAVELYERNHKGITNFGDITKINPEDIPDFDMFTGGFPCQPFSSAGLGKGELDIRGTLFYDIIRICEIKKPKHILLENVKGLTTNRHGQTYKKILSELARLGYDTAAVVLNSKDYGIPQNRERIWIYALKGRLPFNFNLEPPKEELRLFFSDLLDPDPDPGLYKNDVQVERLIEKHGMDFIVKEPLCADLYNKKIRFDRISITITEPHHNSLRVVYPPMGGKPIVRKMSVTEHFRFMGFKDGEIDFGNQSYQQLCKRAGNGWDINLAAKLINQIFIQVEQ